MLRSNCFKNIFRVLVVLFFCLSGLAFEITADKDNDMIFLDVSYENESNVEGNVDGIVIDDSDSFKAINLYLDKTFLVSTIDNAELKLSYSLYDMEYDTFTDNNFRLHYPFVTWRRKISADSIHNFKVGYEVAELDDSKLYDGLSFSFSSIQKNRSYGKKRFLYQVNSYGYGNSFNDERDGYRHRFEMKWYLSKRAYPLTFASRFEHRSADNDGFAFNGLEGKGKINFKLFDDILDCSAEAGLRHRKYSDDYPGFTSTRKDNRFSFSLNGEYSFKNEKIFIGGELLYENNSSNIDAFDLNNRSFGVHLSFLF